MTVVYQTEIKPPSSEQSPVTLCLSRRPISQLLLSLSYCLSQNIDPGPQIVLFTLTPLNQTPGIKSSSSKSDPDPDVDGTGVSIVSLSFLHFCFLVFLPCSSTLCFLFRTSMSFFNVSMVY